MDRLADKLPVEANASDEEAMRLVLAFYCIMEPEKRAEIIRLTEQWARDSSVTDEAPPLSLDRDALS